MSMIGFARVSTQAQDLTNQIERLEAEGCVKIFKGKHSGKEETNKQALDDLLEYAREGDTIVITKLDRLGRSLSQVLQVLDQLSAKGVAVKALDQPIDTTKQDPMSRAMVQLLGMFAEMERNFIVSRTTEGKIASGNYGGRPPKLTAEQRQNVKDDFAAGMSKKALAEKYGTSRATIMRIVNERS